MSRRVLSPFTVAVVLAACADAPAPTALNPAATSDIAPSAGNFSVTLESIQELTPRSVLTNFTQFPGQPSVRVSNSGMGSAVALGPTPGSYWFLTDRGPNVDYPGTNPDGKLFPAPRFAPRLGLFTSNGTALRLTRAINLALGSGKPLTGLPLPLGSCGSTNEKGYLVEPSGVFTVSDPNGIDSEGLAVAPNGDFWISDEYGPFIVRFDAQGRQIARYGPCAGAGITQALPAVFLTRRANRGMEGLTMTPGGKIVGMMQSPLDNPRAAGRASRALRIVVLDPANPTPAATKQYVYLLEGSSLLSSEIVALDETTFLVLERDGNFPPAAVKRIYRISLVGATDESDLANGSTGKSYGAFGATLEAVTDFPGAGIVPVSKELVVDLLTDVIGYPHDKPEGLAVIGNDRIVISNDDDFGVTDAAGALIPKTLPNGRVDFNTLWTVRVSPPLR